MKLDPNLNISKANFMSYCLKSRSKICIIEVYLLKYHFESHLIYTWHYYRQTTFSQLKIMVPYVDISGVCHSIVILWEIYVMRRKCHVMWLRFHFKHMLITGLGQLTLTFSHSFGSPTNHIYTKIITNEWNMSITPYCPHYLI